MEHQKWLKKGNYCWKVAWNDWNWNEGTEGLAWVNTKYADPNDDYPDMQLQFIAGSTVSDGGRTLRYNDGLKQSVWESYYEPISYADSWQPIPIVLRPRSKGRLLLKSTDPYDKPFIYSNYFQDEHDLKVMIEGNSFHTIIVNDCKLWFNSM